MIETFDPALLGMVLFLKPRRDQPNRPVRPGTKISWRYLVCMLATMPLMALALTFYLLPDDQIIHNSVVGIMIGVCGFANFLCVFTRDEYAYLRAKARDKAEKNAKPGKT